MACLAAVVLLVSPSRSKTLIAIDDNHQPVIAIGPNGQSHRFGADYGLAEGEAVDVFEGAEQNRARQGAIDRQIGLFFPRSGGAGQTIVPDNPVDDDRLAGAGGGRSEIS